MNITITKIATREFASIYQLVKESIYCHVEHAFGWDEQYQRHRYYTSYHADNMYWILHRDIKVGIVVYKLHQTYCHLHLAIVFSPYRNQGIGQRAIADMTSKAKTFNLERLTLSSFKTNTSAIQFYQRQGFNIACQDEFFYSLVKNLQL